MVFTAAPSNLHFFCLLGEPVRGDGTDTDLDGPIVGLRQLHMIKAYFQPLNEKAGEVIEPVLLVERSHQMAST